MAGLMLAGFTPVAGALFLLTLSPLGLLPWLPFSPHVDGFLRVTGRAAEVLTLLAVAARIGLPLSRRAALATGGLVLLSVVALSAALAHETQPEPALLLFTLGWLLFGLNAVAGVTHVWRYLRSHETRHRCFAAACIFAGLAEVALLSHAEGVVRLLAEVSRVFAFVMVYRGCSPPAWPRPTPGSSSPKPPSSVSRSSSTPCCAMCQWGWRSWTGNCATATSTRPWPTTCTPCRNS